MACVQLELFRHPCVVGQQQHTFGTDVTTVLGANAALAHVLTDSIADAIPVGASFPKLLLQLLVDAYPPTLDFAHFLTEDATAVGIPCDAYPATLDVAHVRAFDIAHTTTVTTSYRKLPVQLLVQLLADAYSCPT